MPPLTSWIENALGAYIVPSLRGRDAKLFIKSPAFTSVAPTLSVTSPECGPSDSSLHVAHTPLGENRFPELAWQPNPAEPDGPEIKEYLLIVEDPDAPLPNPVVHGIFYAIPATKTALAADDFKIADDGGTSHVVVGGF
ncbi:MAG: hypothetical protein Q9181_008071, partial [Wetmoreana brouardii]